MGSSLQYRLLILISLGEVQRSVVPVKCKRNRNEMKRNDIYRKETKPTEIKQNKTKSNWNENKTYLTKNETKPTETKSNQSLMVYICHHFNLKYITCIHYMCIVFILKTCIGSIIISLYWNTIKGKRFCAFCRCRIQFKKLIIAHFCAKQKSLVLKTVTI